MAKPELEKISLYIGVEQAQKLRMLSAATLASPSALIRDAIQKYLESRKYFADLYDLS